jgi:hypothetical protein
MKPHASAALKAVLEAVGAFECLCRLLTDAFDEARWRLSEVKEARPVGWLADAPSMVQAAARAPEACAEAMARLGQLDAALQAKAERGFAWLAGRCDVATFAVGLIAHHERVQRAKPPNGKRSWLDTYADGRIAIRPAYQLDEPFQARPGTYVQAYRARPLWSFASRLGLVHEATGQEVQ